MWNGVSRKIQYLPFRVSCYCFRFHDNVGVLVTCVQYGRRFHGGEGGVGPSVPYFYEG